MKMHTPIPLTSKHQENGEVLHLKLILSLFIIALVLILGGLYLWGSVLVNGPTADLETLPRDIPNDEPETLRAQTDAEILNTVSSSDELSAIESDVESTKLESMDDGMTTIEAEMDASLQ